MNSKNLTIKLKAFNIAIAMLCMGLLFFYSCQEEEKSGGGTDPSKPIVVTSFKPDTGRISEMVLLDGSNFGTDVSNIKVYFNAKEAPVISSTGTRILALVPRLPGDTCIVSVEVGGIRAAYPDFFLYKIGANASNITGEGASWVYEVGGTLKESRFTPSSMCVDQDDNVFVVVGASSNDPNNEYLVRLDMIEDETVEIMKKPSLTSLQFSTNADTALMTGDVGANSRDRFYLLRPSDAWQWKMQTIKNWTTNGYLLPSDNSTSVAENDESHPIVVQCYADGYYYTRYYNGIIAKINPQTWDATAIYDTKPHHLDPTKGGLVWGMAFHPIRKNELWMVYEANQYSSVIWKFDINTNTLSQLSAVNSGGFSGFRDGPLQNAQFDRVHQISFDSDGNLFLADYGNRCIRKIDTNLMLAETVIGIPGQNGCDNGTKERAKFNRPNGIAVDSEGTLYVADKECFRVRKVAIE
jgi:hypothetical protein